MKEKFNNFLRNLLYKLCMFTIDDKDASKEYKQQANDVLQKYCK